MNELDKLRKMLDEAFIPYESYCETHEDMKKKYPDWVMPMVGCDADRYFRNQIVYGRIDNAHWLFDAIFTNDSFGRFANLIETYGEYGQQDNFPMIMSAEEAFAIISKLEQERKETK